MKLNHLNFPLTLVFLFLFGNTYSQDAGKSSETIEYPSVLKVYSKLSKKVNESSGVILYDGHLWTFNDSGGEPEIYKMDKKNGKVIQTVRIENATNRDWEDITQDDDFIYVGDFGNNRGNRKDLTIYKILKSAIGKGKTIEVEADIILFSYNDQKSFAVKRHKNNYDCEAITNFGDSLLIFSKDWADYKTRMYKLPKTPGTYKIDPVSVFDVNGLVTGADYNNSTGNLVLSGYMNYVPFIVLFEDFMGNDFNAKRVVRVNFPAMKDAQTEGITWLDDNTVIITCEKTKTFKQKAFKLDLRKITGDDFNK